MFTPAFWIIIICLFTHQVTQSAVFVHLVPFLIDIGIEPTSAASVVTFVTLTSMLGRYGFGCLSDLFNKKWLLFILYILQPIGIFGEYYGRKNFGTIYGFVQGFSTFGSIAGPLIAGLVYDIKGSYYLAFKSFALMMVFSALLVLLLKRPNLVK
jgi:MFS family permease